MKFNVETPMEFYPQFFIFYLSLYLSISALIISPLYGGV